MSEDEFLEMIGKRPSGATDPKFIAAKEKETAKIKADSKTIGLAKDAPFVDSFFDFGIIY